MSAAVTVAIIAVAGYLFWPTTLGGCSTLTIVSGHSMEPTYYTGDLVWARCGTPAIGDVVVYEPEATGGARVIHRIVGGSDVDGWVIQGDNNDFVDPWSPDNDQVVGIAAVRIPYVGNILFAIANPYVWFSLLFIAAALYLWPRGANEKTDEDDSVADADELTAGREARRATIDA